MKRIPKLLFAGLLAATVALSANAAQIMYRGTSGQVLTNQAAAPVATFTVDPIPDQLWIKGQPVNLTPVVRSVATGEILTAPQVGFVLVGVLPRGMTMNRQTGLTGTPQEIYKASSFSIQISSGSARVAVPVKFMVSTVEPMSINQNSISNLTRVLQSSYKTGPVASPPTFLNAVPPVAYTKESGSFVVNPTVGTLHSQAIGSGGKMTYYNGLTSAYPSGVYTSKIRATDAAGRSVVYDYSITVNSLTLTPANLTIAPNTPYVGKTPTHSGVDAANRRFIYAGLPAGLSYDESTGIISGKIGTKQSGQSYPVTVLLEATNSGETLSKNFTITVPEGRHRFWRWYPTAWTKTGIIAGFQFAEFRIIDENGQRIVPTQVSSPSVTGVSGNLLSYLWDGSAGTFWEVGVSGGPITGGTYSLKFAMGMDFGTPKSIEEIVMQSRGGEMPQVATGWSVYYSDKAITGPWTLAWSDTNTQASFAANPSYVSKKK